MKNKPSYVKLESQGNSLGKKAMQPRCFLGHHPFMGCFTIRVHFRKLHSSPVLPVEAYFDFKVLLPKH